MPWYKCVGRGASDHFWPGVMSVVPVGPGIESSAGHLAALQPRERAWWEPVSGGQLFQYRKIGGHSSFAAGGLPVGSELTAEEAAGVPHLTVYRHRPGNLRAKEGMLAPYARRSEGKNVLEWGRGQCNQIVVCTTSRFEDEIRRLFRVGNDYRANRFALVWDADLARSLCDRMALLELDHPARVLYAEARGWEIHAALRDLKDTGVACVTVKAPDVLHLSGEAGAAWTERHGYELLCKFQSYWTGEADRPFEFRCACHAPSTADRCRYCGRTVREAGERKVQVFWETAVQKEVVNFFVCPRCHDDCRRLGFELKKCGVCGLRTYVEDSVGSCVDCQLAGHLYGDDHPHLDTPGWKAARERAVGTVAPAVFLPLREGERWKAHENRSRKN